ncbi:Rz1-like lysis system protein LysC [Perlucidibaca piscinae]|uniref:Rz1-like lysis system protein LysC n=1 Tax=Perlucidibaca piscinae TaxID=392589 RepID=UPI0003B78B09|nr:Rz1-like lysis system protein LysC [Perlucidibaca piscinae]
MKTRTTASGLISLCLMLLSGCVSAPPSPVPTITFNGCPPVTPCQLPATAPRLNGQLHSDLQLIEGAWAQCAAQVDTTYRCQQRLLHEQDPQPARGD